MDCHRTGEAFALGVDGPLGPGRRLDDRTEPLRVLCRLVVGEVVAQPIDQLPGGLGRKRRCEAGGALDPCRILDPGAGT